MLKIAIIGFISGMITTILIEVVKSVFGRE